MKTKFKAPKPEMADIGNDLKNHAAGQGLSNAEVARRAFIDNDTVAAIYKGKRVYSDKLIAVANAMGLKIITSPKK